jgi:uncharacterized metal-binding protein YceD (DUF177 family)
MTRTFSHRGPEFSRPVSVHSLPGDGLEIEVRANGAERAALAERFGLRSLEVLTAEARLRETDEEGTYLLHASVHAELTQSCVITLKPVRSVIDTAFDRLYGDTEGSVDDEVIIVLSEEGEDRPEPLVDGAIDVGEAIAEQLGLEIDPFPRLEGAEFEGYATDGEELPARQGSGPFAKLAELRKKME